ncbi:MAG: hypothetical protein ABSH53_21285 [Holophaga sp.]|jgi:hypothetical protein
MHLSINTIIRTGGAVLLAGALGQAQTLHIDARSLDADARFAVGIGPEGSQGTLKMKQGGVETESGKPGDYAISSPDNPNSPASEVNRPTAP